MSTAVPVETSAETVVRPARTGSHPAVRATFAVLSAVASLRLTVVLFSLSMVLVFAGTVAQMDAGIWNVVDTYFWSEFVWIPAQIFTRFGQVFFAVPESAAAPTWLGVWFPGGRLLGFVMLANLLAAHLVRFRAGQTLREFRKGRAAGKPVVTALNLAVKRGGIWAVHTGLILLFLGEIGTRVGQVEQRMIIPEGQTVGFAADSRKTELAFVDRSDPAHDAVAVIPEARLRQAQKTGERLTDPALPVDVAVGAWYTNSTLADPSAANPATAGYGLQDTAVSVPDTTGVDAQQRTDLPSAYVTLYKKGTDNAVGTFLVSTVFERLKRPGQAAAGVAGDFELRFARYYKPFTLGLEQFTVEKYPGTDKPKTYASRVKLTDPDAGEDYVTTISMNQPLRHAGETFFQSSFELDPVRLTVLQVVKNPVWWLPYAACVIVTGGLVVHFGYYLVKFILRAAGRGPVAAKSAAAARPAGPVVSRKALWWAAGTVVLAGLLYYGGYVKRTTPRARLDLSKLGALPVQEGGRVKPLDTLARVHMRGMTHAESVVSRNGDDDELRPALEWLMEVATLTKLNGQKNWAVQANLYKIESEQVRGLLQLDRRKAYRYSLEELFGPTPDGKRRIQLMIDAEKQAKEVRDADPTKLDKFQKEVLQLASHLAVTQAIWQGYEPAVLPPAAGEREWRRPGQSVRGAEAAADDARKQFLLDALPPGADPIKVLEKMPPERLDELRQAAQDHRDRVYAAELAKGFAADKPAGLWNGILDAYRTKDQAKLDAAVGAFAAEQAAGLPAPTLAKARLEARFNAAAPFFHITAGCVLVALLVAAGWAALFVSPPTAAAVRRVATVTLVGLFVVQTAALVARMYLSDRWFVFVTNLYSSAVFIAWGGMALGLIAEAFTRLGVGTFAAAVLGVAGNVIAHGLADSGDTIQMQEAVLDSTFWLSTHVTTVTAGYAATFVAGTLGLITVTLDLTSNVLKKPAKLGDRETDVGKLLGMLTYGVVAFALILSFLGTVLGGIWADQSWGRFWGWDPKENGAVLIVIWNALILHARWGGMVKDRGVAVLAILGNMVTTWSWFGTNQLGVGLHAYGFSKELAEGCVGVWLFHAAVAAAAVGMWTFDRVTGRAKV